MSDEKKNLTEEFVCGDTFFRAEWSYSSHWADLSVWMDGIEDERYLYGHIEWSGCSELKFGHLHWCGPVHYKRHFALLERLYRRSRELLEAGSEYGWDD